MLLEPCSLAEQLRTNRVAAKGLLTYVSILGHICTAGEKCRIPICRGGGRRVEWLIRRDAAALAKSISERVDGGRYAELQFCHIFALDRNSTADCETTWIPTTAADDDPFLWGGEACIS